MRRRAWVVLFLLGAASQVRSGDGEVRLLTDDAIPRYLARGQELARAEQWDKVVDVLHRVVIGDQEVFPDLKPEVLHSAVYSEDGRLFHPARELCLKELARLPPEGLRAYREAHDLDARRLFEEAQATADVERRLARYAQVYDNYLPSSVGDDALEAAGDLSLALGRYYEALALFRRLLDLYPSDTDRDLPVVFAKAAYCAARIGDAEHRAVLLERLASEHPEARVPVEGEIVPAGELKNHPRLALRGGTGPERESDWPLPGGNNARARTGFDLPLDLPRTPLWSFRLAERDARVVASAFGEWWVPAHDREPAPEPLLKGQNPEVLRPYPAVRAVLHDGLLIYKDYQEIVARRPGSGAFRWFVGRYDTPATSDDPTVLFPLDKVRPGASGTSDDARAFEAVCRFLDYGGNTLVAAGDYLVAIETEVARHELRTVAVLPAPHRNRLTVYSRRDQKLQWMWAADYHPKGLEEQAQEEWREDFERHSAPLFLGPGAVSGNLIYTVVRERDEMAGVALWAVDLATGQVRYRTPLHYPDEVGGILPRDAAVAVAGGAVYAVTNSGIVAAVDALPPGRVRWIHRYERNFERRGRTRRGRRTGLIAPGFAYNEPLVTGGKVVVAAPDADELVAFDAETGRLAWRVPRRDLERAWHVVGAAEGLVVLAGDAVVAYDVARGERVWGPHQLRGWPFGRGFVSRRYVYVPSAHQDARRSFVERFDLSTGGREEPLEFDVDKLGNLLSVDGRLFAANGAEVMCFSTFDAELARLDAALNRAEAERSELLHERALLALAVEPKRRDQARDDFARALEAAAAEGRDDAEIRSRAVDNLLVIARERTDLQALDEAAALVPPLAERMMLVPEGESHPYEAQIAVERAEVLGRLGRGEEALAALESFQDRYGHLRVVREGRVIDAAAAAASLREHLRAVNQSFGAAFDRSVRGRIEAARAAGDIETLREIPKRYDDEPPSEQAYFALAAVLEEREAHGQAENVLRGFLEGFPEHDDVARAHLLLARVLARQGRPLLARREANEGISRLDELARAEHRLLIAEVRRLLEGEEEAVVRPRLAIPLRPAPLGLDAETPVPVEGALPEGLALFAGAHGYAMVDAAGETVWRQPDPTETGVEPGPAGAPETLVVAAEIAAARFARAVGEDLVIGDVYGVTRIHAASGRVRWRYPRTGAQARTEALAALDLLREDLQRVRTTGHALRRHPLPGYAMAGESILRVHPSAGVEAIHAGTGTVAWFDLDPKGHVAAGPPAVMGDLVAVGWTAPGWVRVYRADDGAHVNTLRRPESRMVLVAPPVLDPVGRLVLVTSTEPDGRDGEVGLYDVRGESPALPHRYPVVTSNAAVLHADGRLLVFHDGGSGIENLHFVDLERDRHESRKSSDMMRSVDLIRDGGRLFVLTHAPGLADQGARLFRVDLKASAALEYDFALPAEAYARPVLTQRYVAVAAARPRTAHVRLFDREASRDSRGAQPVFALGERETAELDFRPGGSARYGVAPALAPWGAALAAGNPFGTFRLHAHD